MMHRLLTVNPDTELSWLRLYVQPYADRWAAMVVGDEVEPPLPGELKRTGFFGETPAEAQALALRYLG